MIFLLELASWNDRWMLAGISVATVFVILIILVLVLQIFSLVAEKAGKKAAPKAAVSPAAQSAAPLSEASEQDKAAVATAIYLYLNNSHDEESGVLTITHTQGSWGTVLNPRL